MGAGGAALGLTLGHRWGRESTLCRDERQAPGLGKCTFLCAKSIFMGHIQRERETAREESGSCGHRGQVSGHASAKAARHAKGEAFRRAAASDLSFPQS